MHTPLTQLKLGLVISIAVIALLGASAWMGNTAIARGMVAPPEFNVQVGPLRLLSHITDDPYCAVPSRLGSGSLCNTFSLYRTQQYHEIWFAYNRRDDRRPYWVWTKLLLTRLPER